MKASIPDFVDGYHLPNGEHECTMEEIEQRFLFSPQRRSTWEQFHHLLRRMIELGLEPDTLLIDGSFVTGREIPGDVDFAALIPPDKAKEALSKNEDPHDREAICILLNRENQGAIRSLFGAHLLVAADEKGLRIISKFFRRGEHGKLRDPDPDRDPDWVKRPRAKGILRVTLKNESLVG